MVVDHWEQPVKPPLPPDDSPALQLSPDDLRRVMGEAGALISQLGPRPILAFEYRSASKIRTCGALTKEVQTPEVVLVTFDALRTGPLFTCLGAESGPHDRDYGDTAEFGDVLQQSLSSTAVVVDSRAMDSELKLRLVLAHELAHELAHAVGLGHSFVRTLERERALMYPVYSPLGVLTSDDRLALNDLYNPGTQPAGHRVRGRVYEGTSPLSNVAVVIFDAATGERRFSGITRGPLPFALDARGFPSPQLDPGMIGSFDIPVIPGKYYVVAESILDHYSANRRPSQGNMPDIVPTRAPISDFSVPSPESARFISIKVTRRRS